MGRPTSPVGRPPTEPKSAQLRSVQRNTLPQHHGRGFQVGLIQETRIEHVDDPWIGGPTIRSKHTQLRPYPRLHTPWTHMEAIGKVWSRTEPGDGRPTPHRGRSRPTVSWSFQPPSGMHLHQRLPKAVHPRVGRRPASVDLGL